MARTKDDRVVRVRATIPGPGCSTYTDIVEVEGPGEGLRNYPGLSYVAVGPGEVSTHYPAVRNGKGGYGFVLATKTE